MPVESVFLAVRPTLAAWLATQAEDEDLTVEALLDRCVERERRRIDGRDTDNRTRRPGVTPAVARLKPGELSTEQMADAVKVNVRRLSELVRGGIVVPTTAGERGHPHVWHSRQCVAVAILARLPIERDTPDLAAVRDYVDRIRLDACRKGAFVVCGGHDNTHLNLRLIGGAALPGWLEQDTEPVTVLALGPIGAMLNWLTVDGRKGNYHSVDA